MTHLRQTLRTAGDLADAGFIPAEREADVARVGTRYAIALTPAMAELIDIHDPADPIARQFVPDARELHVTPEERAANNQFLPCCSRASSPRLVLDL